MARISKEKWKVYENVFDEFTIQRIRRLMAQNVIEGLGSPVKIGKEANIFTAETKSGVKRIVKIYRLESCNFNKMYDYIRYDPRFLNISKQRRQVIFAWVQREYRNIMKARKAGMRVPTPFAAIDNILVLEYIGDDDVAPQLKDSMPRTKAGKTRMLDSIIMNMNLLHKKGELVHADISEFNILNYKDSPVFIDFSQATPTNNMNANEYLDRDIGNIIRFFGKHGMALEHEKIKDRIIGKIASKTDNKQ